MGTPLTDLFKSRGTTYTHLLQVGILNQGWHLFMEEKEKIWKERLGGNKNYFLTVSDLLNLKYPISELKYKKNRRRQIFYPFLKDLKVIT